MLDKLGMGANQWFVLTNCLFLAVGLLAFWWMGRDRGVERGLPMIIATLLSFGAIRMVVMPLPDAVYFGLSILALGSMCAGQTGSAMRRALFLGFGALITLWAITFRLVGVALAPALILALWAAFSGGLGTRQRFWLIASGAVVAVVAIAFLESRADNGSLLRYADVARHRYAVQSIGEVALGQAGLTLTSIGEVTVNLPIGKFPSLQRLLPFIGLVSASLLIFGARRSKLVTPVNVYVACYVGILLIWPWRAARFWMPVIPFLVAYAFDAFRTFGPRRAAKRIGYAYAGWFALTGLAALAYTTRITFSGERFAALYGTRGGMVTPGFEAGNPGHNAAMKLIVKRYDRARERWHELPSERDKVNNRTPQ